MKQQPEQNYFIKSQGPVDPAQIDITLEFAGQPLPNCGFCTGHWNAAYQGQRFRFYWSIPHAIEHAVALDLIKRGAAHCVEQGWTEAPR